MEYMDGPVTGATLTHFLPSALSYRYDSVNARAAGIVDVIINGQRYQRVLDQLLPSEFVQRFIDITRNIPNLISSRQHRLSDRLAIFERSPSIKHAIDVMDAGFP